MANRYWGELPPPKITRGNSLRVQENARRATANNELTVDITMAGGRSPGPGLRAQPRQDRYSIQTDKTEAPTMSTQSPFVSPVASEFRGAGLAPRPSSYGANVQDQAYNKDFAEKRRRRESRNREHYENQAPIAPDSSRAPPPSSYKDPYNNGVVSYQPSRSRSTKRSDGPIGPEDHSQSNRREEYYPGDEGSFQARRSEPNSGRGSTRRPQRGGVERMESNTSQPRKGSTSEAWAADRSPLQRLELTLDSITKEEKRSRVEEAELQIKDLNVVRGGEKENQNSVRFRNRPITKAPEPGTQAATVHRAEVSSSRDPSAPQEVLNQKSIEKSPHTSPIAARAAEYQSPKSQGRQSVNDAESISPQRQVSTRERSKIPVAVAGGVAAVALARRESNKLRKPPPEELLVRRSMDSRDQHARPSSERSNSSGHGLPPNITAVPEPKGQYSGMNIARSASNGSRYPANITAHEESTNQYYGVGVERQASLGSRHQPRTINVPSRDTSARGQPQAIINKEVPKSPRGSVPVEIETNAAPVRQGTTSKVERLTGEPSATQGPPRNQPNTQSQRVAYDNTAYAVQPPQNEPIESRALPNALGIVSHSNAHNAGVYISPPRLDEWKKGGTALLSGPLLDLDVEAARAEEAEIKKDNTWWEAGNTGRRRTTSSATVRRAEAYDGEYDDTKDSMLTPIPFSSTECEGCVSKHEIDESGSALQSGQAIVTKKKNTVHFVNDARDPPVPLSPILKPHSLTCPTRPARVTPDIAPTRFKPPLFLKSGPLLRYCGMRHEQVKSRSGRSVTLPDRQIWRGSVMIVTQDESSSYELAPTLRLFLQPVNLLPPPPGQVDGVLDDVAPEYVDPIAGLPKIGRDGRTLYIRSVDYLDEAKDLSREESDDGLFESKRTPNGPSDKKPGCQKPHYDGEKAGKYKEVRGFRLHAEKGVTFWRFNIEIELRESQQRIAYRINRGPATAFWVPAKDEAMNIMFHTCNGFSLDVDTDQFCGPDPMWRDVLNNHQTRPFHVMIGGGDQIYNDLVMREAPLFKNWSDIKDPYHKERSSWTPEMQAELESFYLNHYCMWFSQGLFSVAASQIPMINIFDDHDIIDGFGSYSTQYMESPILSGLGAVAFKFYMLFQHQSSIDEGEETEPSWVLGAEPGPFIPELSRSIFTSLGSNVGFLGLDCRTERMSDEIVSAETYHKVFDRLGADIQKGKMKHLIVLVGIPVAYPRMVWLENILTSRAMEPIKFLSRAGVFGKKLLNHIDGGVEILDDLDDHWTARHHKNERNWFIQELQDLAAEKSIRVTILGGDVHLAAVGQFYSNPKLEIPKDHDFRYMPNVISSAIVNTPPPDTLADVLNRRNKVHHLDAETDEDMIPIFTHDVNGKPRNNKRLLNRRNWCSIRSFDPEISPPATPQTDGPPTPPPQPSLFRRLSNRGPSYRPDAAQPSPNAAYPSRQGRDAPPLSNPGFFSRQGGGGGGGGGGGSQRRQSFDSQRPNLLTRTLSGTSNLFRRRSKRRADCGGINGYDDETESEQDVDDEEKFTSAGIRGGSGGPDDELDEEDGYFRNNQHAVDGAAAQSHHAPAPVSIAGQTPTQGLPPNLIRNKFHRTPTNLSSKQARSGNVREINLEGGLEITLNVEVNPKDPTGITVPYRLLVPALWYVESEDRLLETKGRGVGAHIGMKRWKTLKKEKKGGGMIGEGNGGGYMGGTGNVNWKGKEVNRADEGRI